MQFLWSFLILLLLKCLYEVQANKFSNGFKDSGGYQLDLREIQRQNRITTQILQNYLEKRLFPNLQKTSKAPSVWDILPRTRRKPINNIQEVLNGTQVPEKETLESGESERIIYFNGDEEEDFPEEGMF